MSFDSQLLPLLNHSLEKMETVHDILFAAKSCFAAAIVERPTTSNAREKPKLFDGEKVLLNAIDRALLHSKQASDTLTIQRNKIVSEVELRERSRTNYSAALRKLAIKKRSKLTSKQKTNFALVEQNESGYSPISRQVNCSYCYVLSTCCKIFSSFAKTVGETDI